ncbi:MAG: hypothetical protein ACOX1F_06145 [Erysipelotrichaceae bacterium]|jgi:hypothetical protein
MSGIKNYFMAIYKIVCNPYLALCLLIAWVITNGWGYLFIIFGYCFKNKTLLAIGSSYVAFLWVPGTPEKIFTVTIALALQKKFFSNHVITDSPLTERQLAEDMLIKKEKMI